MNRECNKPAYMLTKHARKFLLSKTWSQFLKVYLKQSYGGTLLCTNNTYSWIKFSLLDQLKKHNNIQESKPSGLGPYWFLLDTP